MGWRNLRLSVRNPELRRKLTPDYQPMCKRIVLSGHYYQSIQKPGVHLVTEAIDHIEPGGVVTADGARHELDVPVFATGFDAHAYVRPMEIIGPNGSTLRELWENGAHAYRSVALPCFPNLFMLMGRHSPVGNQSLVVIAEDQADYDVVEQSDPRRRLLTVAPTEVVTKQYNEYMNAAMPQTVWLTGSNSWYLGPMSPTSRFRCSSGCARRRPRAALSAEHLRPLEPALTQR